MPRYGSNLCLSTDEWIKTQGCVCVCVYKDAGVCVCVCVCEWVRYILEKEMATHSITLAWKIPWTEEPGRLRGLQRVGHDWVIGSRFYNVCVYIYVYIYIYDNGISLSCKIEIMLFAKMWTNLEVSC